MVGPLSIASVGLRQRSIRPPAAEVGHCRNQSGTEHRQLPQRQWPLRRFECAAERGRIEEEFLFKPSQFSVSIFFKHKISDLIYNFAIVCLAGQSSGLLTSPGRRDEPMSAREDSPTIRGFNPIKVPCYVEALRPWSFSASLMPVLLGCAVAHKVNLVWLF